MERNYDEVIADMLIQLDQIERRMAKADQRMEKFDKRNDLTIRRMVRVENRFETQDRRMTLQENRMTAQENRMIAFDEKLEQSIKRQIEFNEMQSSMNQYFLEAINKKNGR